MKFGFKDFIIAGGLTELTKQNIELRSLQINDGLIISKKRNNIKARK